MPKDSGTTFPSLPLELQELVLAQALKQLDTKHQFGVVPTVNQQWHGIALSTCRSLQLSIPVKDEAKEEQLEAWLATNKDVLLDLDLKFDREAYSPNLYPLGYSFCQTMERMTQLRTLNLTGCQLPPRQFSTLRELTLLHFEDCMVSPEDLCSLFQLTSLQSLRLCPLLWQPSYYGDDTMTGVLNSICENHQQLTSLEIRLSGPCCICLEPFPSSLYQLKQLQQLSLPHTMVMPQDLQQSKQLPWVAASLRVQADRHLTEVNLPAWMQQQHEGALKHLSLRYRSYIVPVQLPPAAASRALSSLPSVGHLKSLGIFRFDLTQSSHHITALTALTSLEFGGTILDGEVLQALAMLTSLSTLTLKDNKMATTLDHESFRILAAGLCNVNSFRLHGDILSAPNLAAVASSMQQLDVLDLGSLVRLEDVVCLSSLVNLTSLKFKELQLGAGEHAGAAVTALTKLSKLASLVIAQQEGRFAMKDVMALTEAMQLTTLRIWAYGSTCERELSMKVIWDRLT